MSDPTRDARVRYPFGASGEGEELELDLKGNSGSWRGAVPARVGDGPNATTLDPDAANIDPEILRSIKTAALAPIPEGPAEVGTASHIAVANLPKPVQSSGWKTVAMTPPLETIRPQKSERANTSGAVPRPSGSVSGMRAMSGSSGTIRPMTASSETVKAPYELAKAQSRKRMMFIGGGAVAALVVGLVLLKVVGVL